MPIYEYRCNACGHEMEMIQKMGAEPAVECPSCSKPELKKLISASSFKLKGTGWYETDFKDKKPTKETKEENKKTPETKSQPPLSKKTQGLES